MSFMNTLFGGSESSATNNSGGISTGMNQSYNNGLNVNYGTNNSGNSSSGSGSSQSNQGIWGTQSPFLEDVYGQGQGAFTNAMGQVNQLQGGVQGQVSGALDQAQGGYANQLGGGFSAGLQGQVGPNALVNPVANDLINDAAQIKQQNLGGLDARAAAAGMSGSSGYRNQVGTMMDDVDSSTMQQLNSLRLNAQNAGVQNQMALAGMQDQSQQAGMANMGAMQQGAMNQFNPAMIGQQVAANYAGTIGGPTSLTSSSSQNSNSSSGFSSGMNMGLGMNQGTSFGNQYGSNVGSGASNTSTQTGIVPGAAAAKAAGF